MPTVKLLLIRAACLAALLAAASCSSSYRESGSSSGAAGSAATDAGAAGNAGAAETLEAAQDVSTSVGAVVDSVRTGPPVLEIRPVTAFIVRHAEAEQDGTRDPALSEAGRRRALALRERLRGKGVAAIYTSPYRRSRETAVPLAEALGIEPRTYDPGDPAALATQVLLHRGGTVLIVGHGNTVPAAIEALGGERPPDLAHSEHDALFMVEARGTAHPATVTRLAYGDTTTAR